MSNQTKYVAGLYFNEDKTSVALIRKNRPVWQAGKLNAIGGKIEAGESPFDAMVREFKEESGGTHTDWRLFCVLTGENFVVHFFVGSGGLNHLESLTDERIELVSVERVMNQNIIPNLKWLIPMSLDKDKVFAIVKDFTPNE